MSVGAIHESPFYNFYYQSKRFVNRPYASGLKHYLSIEHRVAHTALHLVTV